MLTINVGYVIGQESHPSLEHASRKIDVCPNTALLIGGFYGKVETFLKIIKKKILRLFAEV